MGLELEGVDLTEGWELLKEITDGFTGLSLNKETADSGQCVNIVCHLV